MKRLVKRDPFFDRQPPLSFVEDLKKPLHTTAPVYYGKRSIREGEIDAHGLYFASLYPDDPDGLLDTVYADFRLFLDVYGIGGDRFPVYIRRGETECHEAHIVEISADGVVITADDTEGVRRAVIWLEDELRRRENAYLVPGKTVRVPHIHSRITRCFFSPINRPPKYGDELSDDIDYYPEEYLNRLMHDGANGVWIYTRFSDLMPSSYLTENGKGYEARIAKLNRVIDKCARYGIKVYVFAIEPCYLTSNQAKKYPEAVGHSFGGVYSFCMNTDFGRNYCMEAGERLLKLAPKLAGLISITYGERITSCASAYTACTCPNCRDKNPGELLSNTVEALCSGFRKVNPDFEVVSWTYGHRSWSFDHIRDYVKSAPPDAMLMQNFDDMGYEEQLGRVRQAVDYWLSYVGPSELFRITAEQAKESGKHMFAKMQVCCSHEIASVPYVPVPSILFKKYKEAHRLGVEGIMQCWYFGNYPSLMSKAAGELAFADFRDEDAFLTSLAAIYWGQSKAEKVAAAWKAFEASYRQYPINVMFSYFGPMHDGVVWKLALKPKNFSLPRSWQGLDPIDGDRIGESLMSGHTLEEALTLANGMCRNWSEGMAAIADFTPECDAEEEQLSVCRTIGLLFASGRNILEFYYLRDQLGRENGDAVQTLARMRTLVENEIENSRAMIPLCEHDNRLGYHSEAEGFKFFPEKLEDRIQQLETLLETEFPEVEERIRTGLIPLAYYAGEEDYDTVKRYTMSDSGIEDAPWERISDVSRFRMAYDAEHLVLEMESTQKVDFEIWPEFNLMWPNASVLFTPSGEYKLGEHAYLYHSIFGEREQKERDKYRNLQLLPGEGTHLLLTLNLTEIGVDKPRPMKLKIEAGGEAWCFEEDPIYATGRYEIIPGDYGWILTKNGYDK